MSFISPVPSQFAAVEYVNYTIHTGIGKIRMGGHSKGGNLAIYAAVNCASRVQKRIIEVYNNDGIRVLIKIWSVLLFTGRCFRR